MKNDELRIKNNSITLFFIERIPAFFKLLFIGKRILDDSFFIIILFFNIVLLDLAV